MSWYRRTLAIDPENANAHYGLAQIFRELEQPEAAERHARAHQIYRVDDTARDRAIAIARRNDPAADHAANDVVIYDLARPGAYGLPHQPGS